MGQKIEARWIPSAVNRFADFLSSMWDLVYVRATTEILESIRTEYIVYSVVFKELPLGEAMVARRNYLSTKL